MKGLDLAEAFFLEFGLPAMRQHFPAVADSFSAGLLGRGSEVLGADDGFSRDHGWGPTFRVFLRPPDYGAIGEAVAATLNGLRPPSFRGVDLAHSATDPIGVSTVDEFFRELTGSSSPPRTTREWIAADENALCFARAGRIFYDPLGELARRKQEFGRAYYPRDVWLRRVASKLFRLWHYGSYNLCGRVERRGDGLAALVAQGYFVEAAMQLAFLLNRRFAPYWKWLHWAFVRLPDVAQDLEPMLQQLESAADLASRSQHVSAICGFLRGVLRDHGVFPDDAWRNFMGACDIVEQQVHDPEVRRHVEQYFGRHKHL
jgi:hypothetical protein